MIPNTRAPQLTRHPRKHFLKHAFHAICKLGSKGLKKAAHPSGHGPMSRAKKRRHAEVEQFIFDVSTDNTLGRPELDSMIRQPLTQNHGSSSPARLVRQSIVELSASQSYGKSTLSHTIHEPHSIEQQIGMLPGSIPTQTTFPNSGQSLNDHIVTQQLSRVELPERNSFVSFSINDYLTDVAQPSIAELSSTRLSYPPATGQDPSDLSTHSSPVSPVDSEQFFNAKNFDSPISPSDTNSFMPWSFNVSRQYQTISNIADDTFVSISAAAVPSRKPSPKPWTSIGTRTAKREFPTIRIDTSCTNARSVHQTSPTKNEDQKAFGSSVRVQSNSLQNVPSPLKIDSETRSPVKLVEELRGLYNNFFKLSCAKLCQSAPLGSAATSMFKEYPSAAYVFESGYHALNKFLRGVLPTAFWEVFGLAHLAYASALANQEPGFVDRFPEIFTDLMDWSYAITHLEERARYVQLIQQLFRPESHCLEPVIADNQVLSTINCLEAPQITPTMTFDIPPPPTSPWPTYTSAYSGENLMALQYEFRDEEQLLVSLRKGTVVKLCLDYLSGKIATSYISHVSG